MLKIMMVDDELPALKMAESVIRTFEDTSIVGAFSDPDELLANLYTTETDLVLVDMKMPGMHGLELAGRIQEIKPEVSIVFVTAYNDYAVDAFETDALDYIMKPITAERLKKTIDRYAKRQPQKQPQGTVKIHVRSFGRFAIEKETGELMKFRTAKTEELLAFLLHQNGEAVTKEKIIDTLWYDRDYERAQSMLYTTLYQLRKDLESIGLSNVIQHSRKEGGNCRLSWKPDIWDFAEYMESYSNYKAGEILLDIAKRLIELHKSGYLADNGYHWAESRRNELELFCGDILEDIANREVARQRYEHAMNYLLNWTEMFPYTERVHYKIIALYLMMKNSEEAKKYYMKAADMFDKEMKIKLRINIDELALHPASAFDVIKRA